jgi:hypothetical protein
MNKKSSVLSLALATFPSTGSAGRWHLTVGEGGSTEDYLTIYGTP